MKTKILKSKFKYAFYSTIGKFINVYTFVILLLLSISLSWIPDGLFYFIEKNFSKDTAYIIQLFGGISILLLLFFIGWIISKLKTPKFEMYSKIPDKKRNLIIFLSKGNIENVNQIKTFEDFKKVKTSWQMPAEAIRYHLPKLENIFVVLSSTTKEEFREFESLVNRLFPDKNINIVPIGLCEDIDFENISQVQNAIRETFKIIEEKYKGNERDTIIDITGGQKVVSIIGALQTIINDREFQYVSTSDYSIKSFDIRYIGEDE